MSSFTGIVIAGLEVHEFPSTYDRWFFRKRDRVIECSSDVDEDASSFFVGYRATAATIRSRMIHAGYDMPACERYFTKTMAKFLSALQNELQKQHDEYSEHVFVGTGNRRARSHERFYRKFISAISNTSLAEWIAAFPEAVALQNSITGDFSDGPWWCNVGSNPLVNAMLSYVPVLSYRTGIFNFPGPHWEQFAFAFLLSCPDDVLCELNITELMDEEDEDKFEDLEELLAGETWPHKNCRASLQDIRLLSCSQPDNHSLQRMCYASIITIMEAYLGDILRREIFSRPAVKERFVSSYPAFNANKIKLSDIFTHLGKIDAAISTELDTLSLHKIDTAKNIFSSTLLTEFPETSLPFLGAAVNRRHDIVHRNGKDTNGELLPIGHSDVTELSRQVKLFTREIDAQILDGMQQDIDAEPE